MVLLKIFLRWSKKTASQSGGLGWRISSHAGESGLQLLKRISMGMITLG
jgi:hypothetical protein